MIDGVRETSGYSHGLLGEAINKVGAKNVILGGLSQGCAADMGGRTDYCGLWDERMVAFPTAHREHCGATARE